MYFSEPFTRLQAWIDLLLIANYEQRTIYVRGNKVEVKRGQLAKSQDALCERWRWSRGKVLRFLDELQKAGQIVQQKSNVINLISIVNFDLYQQGDTTDRTTEKNGTTETAPLSGCDGTTETAANHTDNQQYNNTHNGQAVQQNGQQIGQQTVRQIGQPYKEYKEYKNNNYSNQRLESGQRPLPTPPAEEVASTQKPPKTERLPFKEIKDMWNDTCKGYPALIKLSESRKNKMRLRISEMGGVKKAMPLLQDIFTKMQESNFLKGDNRRGWKASFDWVFEYDKYWIKVYEGNYGNSSPQSFKKNDLKINDIWQQ